MSKFYVRDSVDSDIGALLQVGLRERDRVEALRIRGGDDEGMPLLDSYILSRTRRTGVLDGVVVAMFGVVPHSLYSTGGVVWFLASDMVNEERRDFARVSRDEIDAFMDSYSELVNMVDIDNVKSIRWLKWLGFSVADEPVHAGPFGNLFYKFERLSCV